MPGPSILVVDDDDVVREALRALLAFEGYDVATAPDGRAALLALLPATQPMVVLLDLRMPMFTGEDVLRIVLHDPALRRRHAYIVHTANPEALTPSVRNLLEHLRIAVLPKPFDLDTVLCAVEEAERRLARPLEQEPMELELETAPQHA